MEICRRCLKIFFAILSRRLTEFILKNEYIDTSVQNPKGSRMPRAYRRGHAVDQRCKRKGKRDVAVLDLTNANGSFPISWCKQHWIGTMSPGKMRDLILDYYKSFKLRVTSEWHRLEKGIITGCTISVILFALAMNMLVKSASEPLWMT